MQSTSRIRSRSIRYLAASILTVFVLILSGCADDFGAPVEPVEPGVGVQDGEQVDEEQVDEEQVDGEQVDEEQVDEEQVDGEQVDQAEFNVPGITDAEGSFMLGDSLLDRGFQNIDGEVTGEIEDALVDTSTGDILLVTIEYGGFLDIGDTEVSMPLNAFRWSSDGDVILNFDEAALETFPDVGDDWPVLNNPNWDDPVVSFWNEHGIDPGFQFEQASDSIIWLSDLTGLPVGQFGGNAAAVQNVLVDLGTGEAKYVLVNAGAVGTGVAAGEQQVYAVPMQSLNLETAQDTWTANPDFDAEQFETFPRFDQNTLVTGDLVDPGFDEDASTFWTERGYEFD